MASSPSSAKFLEEALSIDVDDSAASGIVESLENQLGNSSSIISCQQLSTTNGNPNNLPSDISNGETASSVNNGTVNGQVDTMSLILNSESNKGINNNHQQGNITPTISNSTVQGVVSTSNFVNPVSNVGIVQSSSAGTFNKTQDGLKTILTSNQLAVSTSSSPRVTYSMQNVNSLPNGTLNVTSTQTSTTLNVSTSIIQGMVSQTFPQSSGNSYQKISSTNIEPINKSGTAVIIKSSACNNVPTGVSSQMTTAISLPGSQMNTAVTVARPATATGAQTTLVNNTPIVLNLNALRAATPSATGNRAATPQRVMIPNTSVRPGQPGITLQALQGLGNPGQQFLVKTENGQFHIIRLATPPVGTTNNTTTIPAGNYRFTVPVCNASVTSSTTSTVQTVTTQSPVQSSNTVQQRATDNSKEKCLKFLTNLLELSSKEPKAVERNVRTLIQELIDSQVEPEEFCDRLEKLLNASPQPCLIGFLRRSLPGLRAAMTAREMTIEGIRPPPAPSHAAATLVVASPVAQLNNQVRPVLGSVQQVRIALPQTPSSGTRHQQPIQHRIITPVRIPTSTSTPITGVKMVTTPSSLSTVPTAVRIQTPLPTSNLASDMGVSSASSVLVSSNSTAVTTIQVTPTTTSVRFSTPRPNLTKMSAKSSPTTTPSTMRTSNASATSLKSNASSSMKNNMVSKSSVLAGVGKQQSLTGQTKITAKDKKTSATTAATSVAAASTPASASGGYVGDDDVNDVAAMAGVNLAEESQRILGPSEFVGTQIRSCKDETFLHTHLLSTRIQQIVAKHGLEESTSDVVAVVSHAAQERLKNILEKLNVIAEHRVDFNKADNNYEISHDIRGQLRCLEELDRVERKRHDEMERELLLRAAKSRSKPEDPEQVKLKAKAKELQRAEMEELRQREANMTALQAIGPRKKIKLDSNDSQFSSGFGNNLGSGTGTSRLSLANRPRLKRVTVRDFLYVMEKEKHVNRSPFLYKSYLK